MTDDQAYLNAVKETLERLQIEPKDLFGYVFWLRSRYAACIQTLVEIENQTECDFTSILARQTLIECGVLEEDVSHETN